MKKLELLAPAKNLETGKAAINCGADAVYIGPPKFGARQAASNTLADISSLIKYAHVYRSKVYVALNTILDDDEILEATSIIKTVYENGADGIIIQDMGLLECDLPPIPLIASTQCDNSTPGKVKFFEDIGFTRAILARELSLDEIREIRKSTQIELEFFVHGALCVSYSGQCYMSFAAGGRSGNRGECAQPCRKKYALSDSRGKTISENLHLLSLKDLNLSERLKDLADAGISSFKIEGRLKDLSYVKTVVSYYRKKIDEIFYGGKGSVYYSLPANIRITPEKTFNRGFTEYFVSGDNTDASSSITPKSMGEFVGKIESVGENFFKLDKNNDLKNGDGLVFISEKKEVFGSNVNIVEGRKIYPNDLSGINPGVFVYRNYDRAFESFIENFTPRRIVPVKIILSNEAGKISLSMIDDENNSARVESDNIYSDAKNKQAQKDTISGQLLKLKSTEFHAEDVLISGPIPFIPVAELNFLRRKCVEKLQSVREKNYERKTSVFIKNNVPFPEKKIFHTGNVHNRFAKKFYERHGAEVVENSMESNPGLAMEKRLMLCRFCLRKTFGICAKTSESQNIGSSTDMYLSDDKGKRYKLKFDCDNCRMEIYLMS